MQLKQKSIAQNDLNCRETKKTNQSLKLWTYFWGNFFKGGQYNLQMLHIIKKVRFLRITFYKLYNLQEIGTLLENCLNQK